MSILALCGSLRRSSMHAQLLRAIRIYAQTESTNSELAVEIFDGLGSLPLFNPDLEPDYPPSVLNLFTAVRASRAVIIASPEYAHGVTGTLKNALDWLVGFPPFAYKPVIVLNASARAVHADAALRETLATMSASLLEKASMTIPVLGTGLDAECMLSTPFIATAIQAMWEQAKREIPLAESAARERGLTSFHSI